MALISQVRLFLNLITQITHTTFEKVPPLRDVVPRFDGWLLVACWAFFSALRPSYVSTFTSKLFSVSCSTKLLPQVVPPTTLGFRPCNKIVRFFQTKKGQGYQNVALVVASKKLPGGTS